MTSRLRIDARSALLVAMVAAALALSGCRNPFLPSAPEPPAVGSSVSVDIDFTSTEGLLATLSQAVAAKAQGNGLRAYLAAFADSSTQGLGLRFDFDPDVVRERSDASVPVPVWTRQYEADFYNYLATLNTGDYDMSFEPNPSAPDVNDAPDHAILHRIYVLTATDQDGNSTQLGTDKADLEMRRLSGASTNWVIVRWTDTIISPDAGPSPADPGLYSFSRLRIDSYNRPH